MLTRDDLINVLRRTTDADGWLTPLLDDPDSAAVLNALADIWSRVSIAIDHSCEAGIISLAPGGRPASVTIRLNNPLVNYTLSKGTQFQDARGAQFVLVNDLVMNSPVVDVALESVRRIEFLNTTDEPDIRFSPVLQVADASSTNPIVITTTTPHGFSPGAPVRVRDVTGNTGANGTFNAIVIDATSFSLAGSFATGPYLGGGIVQPAPGFVTVDSALTPIQGGAGDWLSVLGNERGIQRQAGEPDALYRARVRNIPDAVSPKAIALAVQGIAQQQGLPSFLILEPEDDLSSLSLDQHLGLGDFNALFLDVPLPLLGPGAGTVADSWPFGWDDPLAVIVSRREACAYFRLRPVSAPNDQDDLRPFWNELFFDDPVFGFLDVTDHPKLIAGLTAVAEEVDRKRAACIQFDIDLDFSFFVQALGVANVGTDTVVSTLTPPVGKIWWIKESQSGVVAEPPSVLVMSSTHKIRFTFEDTTTLTVDSLAASNGILRVNNAQYPDLAAKRVTQVEAVMGPTGGQTNRLILELRVFEASL